MDSRSLHTKLVESHFITTYCKVSHHQFKGKLSSVASTCICGFIWTPQLDWPQAIISVHRHTVTEHLRTDDWLIGWVLSHSMGHWLTGTLEMMRYIVLNNNWATVWYYLYFCIISDFEPVSMTTSQTWHSTFGISHSVIDD